MRFKCRRASNLYYINPVHLRELGVELTIRTRNNTHKHVGTEEYDKLKESIRTEGFNSKHPIVLLIRPRSGVCSSDSILDGHHRLNIAIELGLDVVPVCFVY